jgi:hypothetical protein
LTALRITPAEHSLVRMFYWLRALEIRGGRGDRSR